MVERVLTIAGSDSGGGAGIQADLKCFESIGVYGMSAITAVTAQNTQGVKGIHQLPAEFVKLQIDAVMEDIGADAIKIGMLGSTEVVEVVAKRLDHYAVKNIVLDPVIVATSGDLLLEEKAIEIIIQSLFPLCKIVTPNRHEAEVLSGIKINNLESMEEAAQRLFDMGAAGVLIKGGHFESSKAIDIYYNGQEFFEFVKERIETKNTHGTGCTLSSAIAAYLCLGNEPVEAISAAKSYVHERLINAKDTNLGKGHGPICLPR